MKKNKLSDAAYYGLIILFALAAVRLHVAAGWTFPIPWPDEAVFVQQATAFQQHASLFTPQLNPARDILWMPPGYMVLLGGWFKITGSGLFAARSFSLVLTLSIFVLIAFLWKREQSRFFLLTLSGLFFLDRYFIIMGNVARMEALLLLGIVGALVLFDRGKSITAIILLLLLGLIHPNTVCFVLIGFFYLFLQVYYFGDELRANRFDRWLLVIAGVLVSAYLFYAALHWGDFISDMSYQFARKEKRYLIGSFATWSSRGAVCVLLITLVHSLMEKNRRLLLLTLFASAMWIVNKIGHEIWYQVFDAFAYLLVTIVVIELMNPARKKVLYAGLFLVALFVNTGLGMIESPKGYPYSMRWIDMRMALDVPYFTASDKQSVAQLLAKHRKEAEPLHVQFFPTADALFFQDLEDKTIRSVYPSSPESIFPPQRRDIFLLHVSLYLPRGWRSESDLRQIVYKAGIDSTNKPFLLFERDSTERWYFWHLEHKDGTTGSNEPL